MTQADAKDAPVPRPRRGDDGPLTVAAWGLGVFAAGRLAAAVASQLSMAALVAQAVLAEWGLGRLGVTWSDPDAPEPTNAQVARRALVGAGLGTAAAAAVIGLAAVSHGAIVGKGDAPGSLLAIGLLGAGFGAMRDELLLRGLPLRVLEGTRAAPPKLVACAVVTAAAAAADPGATPTSIAVAALLGVLFGALWIRDRGAWLAWGADTALAFVTGPLARGGLLDTRVARSAWGGGDAGLLGGGVALAVLAPLALLAFAWAARASGPSEPRGSAPPEPPSP